MKSGRVLVIASQKGGVGKTTLALNLGYALARRGWRTLLIDADPQGSVGLSIRGELRHGDGLAEVLAGSRPLAEATVETRLPEFSLLPIGRVPAIEASGWIASLENGEALGQLYESARQLYDVILVDTPPGMFGLALGALRRADYVTLPLQAEPLAARSIDQALEVIAHLRSPRLAGLVITMLQSRHEDSVGVVQESWRLLPQQYVLDGAVPRDSVFLEASAEGVPVALLRRRPPAVAAVFDQLAAEFETRLDLEGEDDQERSISLLD